MVVITMMCGSCKARKVALDIKDSTGITQQKTETTVQQITVDQTKSQTVVSVFKKDSTTTVTTITPADGEVIRVNPDGTFTGKAKKVETKTTKAGNEKTDTKTTTANNIKTDIKKDSVGSLKQQVTVHQKKKDVVATPNNAWMIYAGMALLIIFVGIYVVKKFL